MGPKKVGQALYRLAKGHTVQFQDILAKEMKLSSDIIKLKPDYFKTFIVFCNFLHQHKIPAVVFSEFSCIQCGLNKSFMFDVSYSTEIFSVQNLNDLNDIGNRKHFYLKQSECKEVKEQNPIPYIIICGKTKFKPSFINMQQTETHDQHSVYCSGKCLDQWCKLMEDIGLEYLLLSHAYYHEIEISKLKSFFQPLEGTSKVNSSYLLISHILCDWRYQNSKEPSWNRMDNLSKYGK